MSTKRKRRGRKSRTERELEFIFEMLTVVRQAIDAHDSALRRLQEPVFAALAQAQGEVRNRGIVLEAYMKGVFDESAPREIEKFIDEDGKCQWRAKPPRTH